MYACAARPRRAVGRAPRATLNPVQAALILCGEGAAGRRACCTTFRMRHSQMEHTVAPACESRKRTLRRSGLRDGAAPPGGTAA